MINLSPYKLIHKNKYKLLINNTYGSCISLKNQTNYLDLYLNDLEKIIFTEKIINEEPEILLDCIPIQNIELYLRKKKLRKI